MPFNPDEYLASKESGGFNPDEYLASKFEQPEHAGMTHTTSSGQGMSADPLTEEMRQLDPMTRNLVGAGSALAKTYLGAKQLVSGGTLSPENQQDVKDWSTIEQQAPAGAVAGNIGMMVAPGMAISKVPGVVGGVGRAILNPNTLAKSSAVGAGYLGLQPTEEQGMEGLQQRGIEAAKGAGLGLLGYSGAKALGRMFNPQTSAEVKSLMAEGVTPTPGQIIGGGAKKAEEALRSVPILGDAITAAQKRSLGEFNRAAINRSLKPVGEELPKNIPLGYKSVDHAYQTISKKYDDLLPKLTIKADEQFGQDITGLQKLAEGLNPAQAEQFNKILNNEVLGKFTEYGEMSGETMKQVESKLGGLIRGYQRSENYDHQLLGDALQEAQSSIRKMVERANPKYSGQLAKVNSAYANLLRVENAASKTGAKEGIFTPSQLESASRSLDTSLRKRASAHGKALMQDLGTAGDMVLAQKLPNSGTVDRALYSLGGLGGAGYFAGLPAMATTGAGLLGGAGLYTRPMQKGLASLLTKRPELLRSAGVKLSDLAPYTGLAAIGAGQ